MKTIETKEKATLVLAVYGGLALIGAVSGPTVCRAEGFQEGMLASLLIASMAMGIPSISFLLGLKNAGKNASRTIWIMSMEEYLSHNLFGLFITVVFLIFALPFIGGPIGMYRCFCAVRFLRNAREA